MSRLKSYSVSTLKEYGFYLILLILSITIAYTTGVYGMKVGGAIFGGIIALAALLAVFYNYRSGFYFLLFYVFFIFVIAGFISIPIPIGMIVDALCILTLISMWIHFHNTPGLVKEYPFRNIIGYLVIVTVAMDVVQLLNPFIEDFTFGFVTFRETIYLLCTYFIAFQALNTRKAIVTFSLVWIVFSLFVAAYAIKQEHIGLSDVEWNYLRSDQRRYELYVIWGHVRKWSFLSDPSAFGITMAFCGIFCFVIALRKF